MKFGKPRYGLDNFIDDVKRTPFLRLAVPFLAGIICQDRFAPAQFNVLYLIIILTVCLIVAQTFKVYHGYSRQWLFGLLCYPIFFLLGVYLVEIQPKKTSIPLGEKNYYSLLVTKNPRVSEKSVRLDVDILGFSADGKQWNTCSEHSVVYCGKNTEAPKPGTVFICPTVFNECPPPLNPGEFDYKRYLERNRIFVTSFVNFDEIAVVDSGRISFYKKFIFNVQNTCYEILQKAGLSRDELSVAMALLIGNREYLDNELSQAYAAAGSIHLLAVSGLHVGIIFMVLGFLLQFMEKNLKFLKNLIIITILWGYASIAGMSPSIVRACLMFSVFLVADIFNKPKNTYNSIAFSCFLICLFNPYSIFEIGFQLSYLAVIGIVYFQPKFMKIFRRRRNKFRNALAGCLTVTLAAQLGTLPVILYLFQTFPTYFVFSNLLLVPFTSIVMYVGLFVLALFWNPFLLSIAGWVLNLCIKLMNITVMFCQSLPYSVIGGIYLDGLQCALLVVGIFMFALWLLVGKRRFLNMLLISMTGIFALRSMQMYNNSSHREFGMFGLKRNFYAYFIENGKGMYIRDNDAVDISFDFNTKNYLTSRGFKSERSLKGFSLNDSIPGTYKGILLFSGYRIALLSQLEIKNEFAGTPLNVDYLYVTGMRRESPETVFSCYDPKEIIISGNLPRNKIAEWITAAESRQIPCRNVGETGFWNKIPDDD